MEKLAAIKNEILTDPFGLGYTGKDAGTQAIIMNSPVSQSPQVFQSKNLNSEEIVLLLIKRGKWQAVLTASAAANINAKNLVELVKLGNISCSAEDPSLKTIIMGLVSDLVLTGSDAIAIRDLFRDEVKMSRSNFLGLGDVSQGDVEQALK